MTTQFTNSRERPSRRGIATLEFAMALPVLLLLMVGITWLGFSVIGQTQVLVTARNKAWKQRFDDKAKRPLMFPSGLSVAKNPFYSTEADYVTEKATQKVQVSPIFNGVPGPEASHTILAGSWDHRAMPFDKPPEWKLMATAAASGKGGSVQTWLTNLSDPLGRLKDIGANILAENARRMTEIDTNNAASDTGSASANQAKEQNERDREAEKRKYEEKIRKLGGFVNPLNNQVQAAPGGLLDETEDEIARLQAELASKEQLPKSKDEETAKKQQAEIDKLRRDLDLEKGKKQRIESEIRDAVAELKALQD